VAEKLYLDTSVFNRPFDDQAQARIRLETDAFLAILEKIEQSRLELIGSSVLRFETDANPSPERQERIQTYLNLAKNFVEANEALGQRAKQIEKLGFKAIDALHLAAAEREADVLLTVDDRLMKRALKSTQELGVRVMNPIDFVLSKEFVNA
jgi:predicted nucleic acid-binding protein